MWQHLGVPRVLLMSARGQPLADVIMAIDDVSVDLVNIDQVNESTRVHVHESVGPTCRSLGVTDRQDPHVRLGLKKRKEATRVNGLKGGSSRFSRPNLAQRLGSMNWAAERVSAPLSFFFSSSFLSFLLWPTTSAHVVMSSSD